MDSCLIFVPFGHYDELECLPYQNTSMCPRSADVGQMCRPVNGRYTTAFSSSWARWMKWFPKEIRFSERSIRNLVGSEDELDEASKRLGHADTSTTARYYRLKPTIVTPLSSHSN